MTSAPDRDSRLEHLMRALLAFADDLDSAGGQRRPGNGVEEILIDADVDGRRYLLIKMPAAERKCPQLSPRELEIVRMVAQGHPNKIIAVVLNISAWTVCTHLRRIFAKLGVSSRASMVARLSEFGSINAMTGGSERAVPREDGAAPARAIPPQAATGREAVASAASRYAQERAPAAVMRAATNPRSRRASACVSK